MIVETKGLLQSKTVWGAIAVIAVMVFKAFGFDISEQTVTQVIEALVQLIGFIMIFVGRKNAKAPLRGLAGRKIMHLDGVPNK